MRTALYLLLLLHGLPAAAWGGLGHRLICRIAWLELAPPARQEIDRLLKTSHLRRFEDACNWPDRIRDEPEWEWTRPHHYVNVDRPATRVRQSDCPAAGCVLRAVGRYTGVLQQPDRPDRERLPALLFLSHYVGDIHQPMHVAYGDDRGGNETRVSYLGKRTNLHALWDSRLISLERNPRWSSLARDLRRQARDEKAGWLNSSTLDWADESLHLTRRIYRELDTDGELDREYFERYHPLVRERISQAGVRLAGLLKQLLVESND